MAFVPAVSQRKQDHRLSRFTTGLDVRIGASSSPRSAGPSWRAPAFSEVRPGARAHTRRRRASHWPESALRARSLASLIVRFRPASGPRRPGAARRRRPPPPWLPLGGVTPPGWPTAVCGAGVAAQLRENHEDGRRRGAAAEQQGPRNGCGGGGYSDDDHDEFCLISSYSPTPYVASSGTTPSLTAAIRDEPSFSLPDTLDLCLNLCYRTVLL